MEHLKCLPLQFIEDIMITHGNTVIQEMQEVSGRKKAELTGKFSSVDCNSY
jgi:hypothetical protein